MKDLITGVAALLFLCLFTIISYQLIPKKTSLDEATYEAILNTLNEETEAFFSRDYEHWTSKWVHKDYIYKSYMIMTDSSMSEMLGWQNIEAFGRDYIKNHLKPEVPPTPLSKIEVRFYGEGAWVSFQQQDPQRGLKRETRLLEKEKGEWKIAGMHTTVYGFD